MVGRRPRCALAGVALLAALGGCGAGSGPGEPVTPPAAGSVTAAPSAGALAPLQVVPLTDGGYALRLDVEETDLEALADATGHEPNGPFWEGVAGWLVRTELPQLQGRFRENSEAGLFQVEGPDRVALRQLGTAMAPYVTDPAALAALVHDAEAAGFPFDD